MPTKVKQKEEYIYSSYNHSHPFSLLLPHVIHQSLPAPNLSHHLEHLSHFPAQFQITVPHLAIQQLALWVLQPVFLLLHLSRFLAHVSKGFTLNLLTHESDEIPYKATD